MGIEQSGRSGRQDRLDRLLSLPRALSQTQGSAPFGWGQAPRGMDFQRWLAAADGVGSVTKIAGLCTTKLFWAAA